MQSLCIAVLEVEGNMSLLTYTYIEANIRQWSVTIISLKKCFV